MRREVERYGCEARYIRPSTSFVVPPYSTGETNRCGVPPIYYRSEDAPISYRQHFVKRCGRHRAEVISRGGQRPDVVVIREQRRRGVQQRLRERGAGLGCGKQLRNLRVNGRRSGCAE